jgi:hypothetical protein
MSSFNEAWVAGAGGVAEGSDELELSGVSMLPNRLPYSIEVVGGDVSVKPACGVSKRSSLQSLVWTDL